MSSIFTELAYAENKTYEKKALPVGQYGNGRKGVAGLKVVKYIGERIHPFLGNTTQHSYLVAATKTAEGVEVEGTAFLTIEVTPYTLTPEAVAVVFDREAKAIEDGLTTQENLDLFKNVLRDEARKSLVAKYEKAGEDPATITDEHIDKKVMNLRINLQNNLGNILALQVWAGHEPGISVDWAGFGSVQFAGSTVDNGRGGTDVKRVFKKGK